MSLPYKTFGSYILFKEILNDPLGQLYRAAEFDKKGIKRTAFVRILDTPSMPKDDIVGEIDTAQQIAKILHATNIAANPALTVDGGTPALAFDFVPSHPLSRVFEKVHEEGFPVPVDNALLILEKLALALSAALAVDAGGRSLVHGFLHPGLIMVSNDGEGVVTGFGFGDQLLTLVDDPEIADSVHPYVAPEVLVTHTATKRSDVYSLGSILFQLLTGKPVPAQPEQREGILDNAELAYDERPIPDDIKVLLTRALAARPEERFSSAADFKKELDKLLYGGAYSPTTFNLALFMDRLFRNEIEVEEQEMKDEANIDVEDYISAEPEIEAEAVQMDTAPLPRPVEESGPNKGLLIGIGVAVVAIAIALGVVFFGGRGQSNTAELTPTPTQEELEAKAKAEAELLERMIEAKMAEREAELKAEMEARQKTIDDLQQRLQQTEKKTGMTDAEKQQARELQRQIAAEQEAKRQREAEAEKERQRALEDARLEAERQQAATATAVAIAEAAQAKPTEPPVKPTEQPAVTPTPEVVITENMFIEPSQVDEMPVLIKDEKVDWTRQSLRSNRKGMIILQATVNASGIVENVTVLRADEEGFGIPEAVVEAVKEYRFKPATKNGIKVKSYATVTKRFNFRGR